MKEYDYYSKEYEKGLQDQTDEIEELRRKLEIAKRDTSLQGLKHQKEIAEDLAKAEEDLAKYTQDKIDDDYNESILIENMINPDKRANLNGVSIFLRSITIC